MNTEDYDFRLGVLAELGTATQHVVTDEESAVYLKDLERFDTATFSEGCSRLMGAAKFFPRLSELRESCRQVRAEEERAEAADLYRDRELMPQSRAEMWMEHLKAVILALKHGRPLPAPPVVLDSARDTTYRCFDCRDTGFKRECHCGQRGCRSCHYKRVMDCHCKPPRPEPIPPSFKRHARAR